MKNTLQNKKNSGFIGLIPGLVIGGMIAAAAIGGVAYIEYQKIKSEIEIGGFQDVGSMMKFDTPLDAIRAIYDGIINDFFAPLPIAPIDLDSVPSSPDPSKPPAGGAVTPASGTITQSCYSSEVATLKYSECGRTYQSKKDAVLYSDSAATLIPIYAKEYDACTDAVYANRCK